MLRNGYTPDVEEINSLFKSTVERSDLNLYLHFHNPQINIPFSSSSSLFTISGSATQEYKSSSVYSFKYLRLTYGSAGDFTIQTIPIPFPNTINYAGVYFVGKLFGVIDECDDGSIDTSVWTTTTSGVTETTQLDINNTTTGGSNEYAITKDLSSYKILYFKIYHHELGYTGNHEVILTDGTNEVTIYSKTLSSGGTYGTYDFKLFLDTTNNKAIVSVTSSGSNSESTSVYDISSLSGSVRLKFNNYCSGSGGADYNHLYIYYLRCEKSSYDSTITYYISADDTNFEEVNRFSGHKFTNTGSTLTAKIIGNLTSDEGYALFNIILQPNYETH